MPSIIPHQKQALARAGSRLPTSQGPRWLPEATLSALSGAQSHAETVMVPTHMYVHIMCVQKRVRTHAHTLRLIVLSLTGQALTPARRNDKALAVRKQAVSVEGGRGPSIRSDLD